MIVGSTSVMERERGGGTEEMEVGGGGEELGCWCWRRNRRNGVEEEAKSWAPGARGRNPKWRRQKIEMGKWEKGKCKIGYLYLGFIRVF